MIRAAAETFRNGLMPAHAAGFPSIRKISRQPRTYSASAFVIVEKIHSLDGAALTRSGSTTSGLHPPDRSGSKARAEIYPCPPRSIRHNKISRLPAPLAQLAEQLTLNQ